MSIRHLRVIVTAVFVAALAIAGGGVAGTSGAAAQPYCGITWGSLPKASDAPSSAPLGAVRTGQHDCYDRVVFDFEGPATGYTVAYAEHVYSEGRGDELSIAGGARLAVFLQAPAYDVDTGTATYPHRVGEHVANLTGYRTLRDVVYGGSFEGSTTFGIGVRARLPFRVLTLSGPGAGSRIVIDVAHQWTQ